MMPARRSRQHAKCLWLAEACRLSQQRRSLELRRFFARHRQGFSMIAKSDNQEFHAFCIARC